MSDRRVEIRRFTIDDVTHTPIVAPMPSGRVVLYSAGLKDAFLRSDPNDAQTEETLFGGTPLVLEGDGRYAQFWTGDTVLYIRAASGLDTIIARFTQKAGATKW